MINCEPNSPFINLGTMPKSVSKKNILNANIKLVSTSPRSSSSPMLLLQCSFFALHHHLVCCYFIKSIHYSIQIVMTMMMCNKMNEICLQTTIKVEDVDFMAGVFLLCVSKIHIVFNASMRSGTTDCTYSFESH